MIVDAHIHFWDPGRLDYPWLPEALRRPFLPSDVDHTGRVVVVEADALGDELSWLEELAAHHGEIAAIVAHAPLEQRPDLGQLAARPLVKGVRRLLEGTDLFDAVADGVRELAAHELPFDACVTHDQLPALTALAASCPDTVIVLDHLGKPDIAGRGLDPWRANLAALARCENVVCKLSGLTTEAGGRDVRRYLEHALEVFGPERCLVGSDWPVASLTTTYEQWLDVVCGLLSEAERASVLGATAERVYRLSSDTNQEER